MEITCVQNLLTGVKGLKLHYEFLNGDVRYSHFIFPYRSRKDYVIRYIPDIDDTQAELWLLEDLDPEVQEALSMIGECEYEVVCLPMPIKYIVLD